MSAVKNKNIYVMFVLVLLVCGSLFAVNRWLVTQIDDIHVQAVDETIDQSVKAVQAVPVSRSVKIPVIDPLTDPLAPVQKKQDQLMDNPQARQPDDDLTSRGIDELPQQNEFLPQ